VPNGAFHELSQGDSSGGVTAQVTAWRSSALDDKKGALGSASCSVPMKASRSIGSWLREGMSAQAKVLPAAVRGRSCVALQYQLAYFASKRCQSARFLDGSLQ